MRINSVRFGLAFAIAAAVVWLVCALFVFSMPGPSMMMSRHMMHSDMGNWNWTFSLAGAFAGTLLWAIFAFLFGWIVAVVYNALSGRSASGES